MVTLQRGGAGGCRCLARIRRWWRPPCHSCCRTCRPGTVPPPCGLTTDEQSRRASSTILQPGPNATLTENHAPHGRRQGQYNKAGEYIILFGIRFLFHITLNWYIINVHILMYHGLYGSTSCCISHGPSQWEKAIFDPPQLGDPSTDFHETWNI